MMIKEILASKYSLVILKTLYSHKNQELFLSEIAGHSKLNIQTTKRVLDRLAKVNLVTKNSNRGRLRFYRINPDHPFIENLTQFFNNWDRIEASFERNKKSGD